MRRKKFCIALVMAAIVAVAGIGIYFGATSRDRVSRQAAETAMELYDQVFGKYYKTLSWTTRLISRKTNDDGIVEERFFLEGQWVMNAETPEELDFCQGMLDWCGEHDVAPQKVQATAMYQTMKDSIENPRGFIIEVKAFYPEGHKGDITILVNDGSESYCPMEDTAPDDEVNRMSGYRYMGRVFGGTSK